MWKIWGVPLVLLLVGCGFSLGGDSIPTFSSAAEVQAALNEAGLSCTGYETALKGDREWGMEDAIDVAECDVEGESITLAIWKDRGQKENWAGTMKQFGCMIGQAFGVQTYDYVNGALWTVSDTTQTLSKQIADQVGGRAVHVDCSDVEMPSG